MIVNIHEQMNIYIYDWYMYIVYVCIYVTMTVCINMLLYVF